MYHQYLFTSQLIYQPINIINLQYLHFLIIQPMFVASTWSPQVLKALSRAKPPRIEAVAWVAEPLHSPRYPATPQWLIQSEI